MKLKFEWIVAVALLAGTGTGTASEQTAPPAGDIPAEFKLPIDARNYVKREEMVPMRDGTKLFTVIVIPKGATNAPIILTRGIYDQYEEFRRIGGANEWAKKSGFDQLPAWQRMVAHPNRCRICRDR